MDEIIIRSKFMQNLIKKFIEKKIREKLIKSPGLMIDFKGPIDYRNCEDGYARLDLNVSFSLPSDELKELIKQLI